MLEHGQAANSPPGLLSQLLQVIQNHHLSPNLKFYIIATI
jgi:hypothetical protein